MRLILPLLLLSLPAFAAEKFDVKMNDGRAVTISLVEAKETARLKVEGEGQEALTSEVIGEEFQEFTVGGKDVLFAAQDLDGDGNPEIIVRTTLPPRSGQVHVFRIEAKSLAAVKFDGQDFLEVSHGGDVTLGKGEIRFEPEGSSRATRRTVRYRGQGFSSTAR